MADGSAPAIVTVSDRQYVEIEVGDLHYSPTQPRDLPRDDFAKLAAAVSDITSTLTIDDDGDPVGEGIRDPLRVRRRLEGGFEIVDGERRWHAARIAGLRRLTCEIVVLSDSQVAEEQLIKNGSRVDLSPLEEARAFARLRDEFHLEVDEMAARVGKPARLIRQRLQLLHLIPAAAEGLASGRYSLAFALELAAVSPAAQADVVKEFESRALHSEENGPEPLTAREMRWTLRRLRLRLVDGGFPLDDASLVPSAGSCLVCQKRSGVQSELWADGVEDKDNCTDKTCFVGKQKAHAARLEARATADHVPVIKGKDAKKIFSYGEQIAHDAKLVDLDKPCDLIKPPAMVPHEEREGVMVQGPYRAPTWREVLADKLPKISMLAVDGEGKAHELLDKKEASAALKATGYQKEAKALERQGQVDARPLPKRNTGELLDKWALDRKAKDSAKLDALGAIATKAAKRKADVPFWRFLAGQLVRILSDVAPEIAERRGIFKPDPKAKQSDDDKALLAWIAKEKDEGQLRGLVVELAAAGEGYVDGKETTLDTSARFYDVDLASLRKAATTKIKAEAAEAAEKAKAKKGKGAKGKPAAKAKAKTPAPKKTAKASTKASGAKAKAEPTREPSRAETTALLNLANKKPHGAPESVLVVCRNMGWITDANHLTPAGRKLVEGPAQDESGTCRVCKCTDEQGCAEVCSWSAQEQTLCTVCSQLTEHVLTQLDKEPASKRHLLDVIWSNVYCTEPEDDDEERLTGVLDDLFGAGRLALAVKARGSVYSLVGKRPAAESDAKPSSVDVPCPKCKAPRGLDCTGNRTCPARLKALAAATKREPSPLERQILTLCAAPGRPEAQVKLGCKAFPKAEVAAAILVLLADGSIRLDGKKLVAV